MPQNRPSDLAPTGGVFQNISNQVRLIIRLMADRRVNPLLKLLPLGSLVYMLNPMDVPGPVDDALVAWIGTTLFVELCPPALVEEHLAAIQRLPASGQNSPPAGEVVEGEARDLD